MKLKIILIVITCALLAISISQIFSIPPYAGDIYGAYRSGYFSELDRQFRVIKDSFITIKMYTRPAYAWVFLNDMAAAHGIKITVYDAKGNEIPAPGDKSPSTDRRASAIASSLNPQAWSETRGRRYYSAIPVPIEDRCRFCHHAKGSSAIAGVITFERPYDAHIYYSSERTIIFTVISVLLCAMLVLVWRWDPDRKIKELFDKQ